MSYENSMSPADYAAVNGSGGFGGNNGWEWLIILFLFGWGRGSWGGGNGSCGSGSTCATPADVTQAVDRQTFIGKLDGLTYGLTDSTYALNNTIMQGFHGVDNALCGLGHDLTMQIADCCCKTQRGIDSVNFSIAQQTNALQHQMCMDTRDIIENQNANGRAILDFLKQDKIDSLREEVNGLRLAASQSAQNAYLIQQLRPSPIPSYPVANPYCCQPACGCGCGNGFGYGG